MKVLLIICALMAAGLSLTGCGESYSWHQKMTIEVETPSGIRKGSSVVAVSWRENDPIGAANGPQWINGLRGEAAVIDLGGGRFLFALLSRPGDYEYTGDLVTRIMGDTSHRARGSAEFEAVGERGSEPLAVPRQLYPLMVTFADIADPKTVAKVDPDDLAASFGPGVRLKRVTIEITDEPVTEGQAEKVLPCLNSGQACIPLDKTRPYGEPMRNILNSSFRSR